MGSGNTFLEQVTRVNTDLGTIASTLEWIRDGVSCGDLVVEECRKDEYTDRIILKVSVRTDDNWK